MKAKSLPEATPELQKKPGCHWSRFEGGWYKKGATLGKEEKEKMIVLEPVAEETSSTVSPSEEAWIQKEVLLVMNQQFVEARAKLENNLVAHVNISKSGNATVDADIIDLISQSIASLQKS